MKKVRAYTMIELLLYIGMVSVFIVALAAFIGFFTQAKTKSSTIEEVNQQGLLISEYINQIVRDSTNLVYPTKGNFGDNAILTSAKYPSRSPIAIKLIGGKIYVNENNEIDVQLTSDKVTITSLSFYNLSQTNTNGNLKYVYTIAYNNVSGKSEFNYTQTFYGNATTR